MSTISPPSFSRTALAMAALFAAASASAHITLPPGGATAGSDYEAAFRVGHACKEATSTTGVAVRLPRGFTLIDAQPRAGWRLEIVKAGEGEVRWTADNPGAALPASEHAEFILRGKLTSQPGTLWFKVLQSCDNGLSADWAQIPAAASGINAAAGATGNANTTGATGTAAANTRATTATTATATSVAADKLPFPAARLDVLPPGVAAVDVKDAWVRPTVPGQSGTGAFMKLSAPAGARLVGVSTPAAGVAELHEMKMEGDTMKMRPLPGGLLLAPRQTVELKAGGHHVMLMDLKKPLTRGSTLPLTLRFEDAKGGKSTLEVNVPVGVPQGVSQGVSAGADPHAKH